MSTFLQELFSQATYLFKAERKLIREICYQFHFAFLAPLW